MLEILRKRVEKDCLVLQFGFDRRKKKEENKNKTKKKPTKNNSTGLGLTSYLKIENFGNIELAWHFAKHSFFCHTTLAPHSPQNFLPGSILLPQLHFLSAEVGAEEARNNAAISGVLAQSFAVFPSLFCASDAERERKNWIYLKSNICTTLN